MNRYDARSGVRNKQRGDRGGQSANGYFEDYPALGPSTERKGKIKFHAANEKKMKGKAAQESDDDEWGWIGEDDGKAGGDGSTINHDSNTAPPNSQPQGDPNYIPPHLRPVQDPTAKEPQRHTKDDTEGDLIALESKPIDIPLPSQRLMARIKLLDAYEDDGEGGVPLL